MSPESDNRDYLGDLTDELEESGSGSFIDRFVSRGPKNFSVICPSTGNRKTKRKMKGIILNYKNSKVVNFTALRNMILEDAPPAHVHNSKNNKKTWWCSGVRARDQGVQDCL